MMRCVELWWGRIDGRVVLLYRFLLRETNFSLYMTRSENNWDGG